MFMIFIFIYLVIGMTVYFTRFKKYKNGIIDTVHCFVFVVTFWFVFLILDIDND